MADLPLLSEVQMRRIEAYFPLLRGVPRLDDRHVLSDILFVIRNGLHWHDAAGADHSQAARHNFNGHKGTHRIPARRGRERRFLEAGGSVHASRLRTYLSFMARTW
jgi:transposase